MKMKICSTFVAASVFIFGVLLSNVNSQAAVDSCSSNLDLVKGQLPFDATSFNCNPVWSSQGYILRYKQTAPGEWSFVLSAPNSNSYIGMGFSPDGNMVGSSAVVGWVRSDGIASMKRYFLGGQNSNLVAPDQGNLQVGNSSIVNANSRIYMAFQLVNTDKPESRLIYSVGPSGQIPSAPNFRLTQHTDYVSTVLNYATGQTQTEKNTNTDSLRKSHGILVMLGWGILMLIGVMVARYMRQWDPIWFYSHTAIQSLGFVLGVAGIICGFVLSNRVSTDVDEHKTIGIIVLVLGCLQVMAFLARPNKESKVRKYWNWYHLGVGRSLILLAAVNVFYGIHISKAGTSWNAGYAVVLVALFVTAVILEVRMRMRD